MILKKTPVGLFFIFLALVIVVSLISVLFNSLLLDACNSPINSFESVHCGTETPYFGKGQSSYTAYDLTLQPFVPFSAYLFKNFHVYDDIYAEYQKNQYKNPASVLLFPWFRMEIDTYTPNAHGIGFVGGAVIGFSWVLNFLYWSALALVFTKLWKTTRWWGKLIVVCFFIDKLVFVISI